MLWRICRERVTLLYGAAAAVLQVAHPRIALGVLDHSDFQSSPLARLERTLDSVNTLAFGARGEAQRVVQRINSIHRRVQGDASSRSVPGPAHYSAFEHDLLMWVIATMIMAALEGYEVLIAPVSDREKELFYADMRLLGTFFELPRSYGPQSWSDFLVYWRRQLEDPALGSHPISRQVAWSVARPRHPWWFRIVSLPLQFMFSEILPAPVGERLGFRSTPLKRVTLRVTITVLRLYARLAPAFLRFVPHYNQAIRQISTPIATSASPDYNLADLKSDRVQW